MDIWTGKDEVDIYERENPPPEPKNTYAPHLIFLERIGCLTTNKLRSWEKIWFAIA